MAPILRSPTLSDLHVVSHRTLSAWFQKLSTQLNTRFRWPTVGPVCSTLQWASERDLMFVFIIPTNAALYKLLRLGPAGLSCDLLITVLFIYLLIFFSFFLTDDSFL